MPPNNPQTALSLDEWRRRIGLNPWHFAQLASDDTVPVSSACNTLTFEYSWQHADQAGRHDVRNAMRSAEDGLRTYLNFDIAPTYHEETQALVTQPRMYPPVWGPYPIYYTSGQACNWFASAQLLTVGKVNRIATRTWVFQASAAVDIADTDGDGVIDAFTAVIPDPGVNIDLADLAIFFQQADWPVIWQDSSLAEWIIRPVTFARTGGNIRVTGPSWLIVKPSKYEGVGLSQNYIINNRGLDSTGALDPNNLSNYIAEIDFYAKTYTDENLAYIDVDSCGTVTSAQICATILDREVGIIQIAPTLNQIPCLAISAPPTWRLRINYEAGDSITNWQDVVVRYAAADLVQRICNCEAANRELFKWQQDRAKNEAHGDSFKMAQAALGCIFGTRAGHYYAWERVRALRLERGVSV